MGDVPDDRPGSSLTDLEGSVSDGDNLDDELSSLSSGEQIYIPPGSYTGDFTDIFNISAGDATIYGDPDGVDIQFDFPTEGSNESSPSSSCSSGTLRIENINLLGEMGHGQHRWQLSADGRIELVNVNFVDGAAPCTDSYAHRLTSGSDGEVMFKNCYYGNFGNSCHYMTDHNAYVEMRGCAFRSGGSNLRMGGDCEIYNTVNYFPEPPGGFCEGPNAPPDCQNGDCGRNPRMTKYENDGDILMENCDCYISADADDDNGWPGSFGDGPVIDFRRADSSMSVTYRNCRFSNETREIFDTASAPDSVADNSFCDSVHCQEYTELFSGASIDGDITTGSAADPPRVRSEAALQEWVWTPVTNVGGPSGPTGDTSFTLLEYVAENTATSGDTMTVEVTFDGEVDARLGPDAESGEDEIVTDASGNTVIRSPSFNLDGAVDSFYVDEQATVIDLLTDGGSLAEITWQGTTYTESEFRSEFLDGGSGSDYDTITVSAGETRVISVGDNETLSNTLVDVTAEGAFVFFDANGSNWEIRNVGVRGKQADAEETSYNNMTRLSVDEGSTGIVDGFYADGVETDPADGGCFFARSYGDYHKGNLIIQNAYVANFPDNGCYTSDVARRHGPDNAGEVHVKGSYFENNNVSAVRLGSTDSTVTDTSIVNVGPIPSAGTGIRARGVWFKDGGVNMLADNCNVHVADDVSGEAFWASQEAEGHVTDTAYVGGTNTLDGGVLTFGKGNSSDTTTEVPAGVPTTPEEAASGSMYETIHVPAGEHHEVTVGAGETLQGLVLDISADGASGQIVADSGGSFTIRDVAVRGKWPSNDQQENHAMILQCDAGNTGIVDNVYLADGTDDTEYPGPGGIYVRRPHAGTVKISRANIQDWADNGIYASTPGYPADNPHDLPEGGGGVVEIEDCYASNCGRAHYRLGTDGSYALNCVADGKSVGDRGFSGRFNDTTAIDCDFGGHSAGDVACGTDDWPSGADATVTVDNCRFSSVDTSLQYQGTIDGASQGSPTLAVPEHVPSTPDEAATGETGTGTSNSPPTASFTYSPTDIYPGVTVTLDATDSFDADGNIIEYDWDIGGTRRTGETATIEFSETGNYTTTLTVTDDDGASSTDTQTISVVEDPNKPGPYVVSNRRAYARHGMDSEPSSDIIRRYSTTELEVVGVNIPPGGVDDFQIGGEIVGMDVPDGFEFGNLIVDGAVVQDKIARITIDSSQEFDVWGTTSGESLEYEFVVDGSVEPLTDLSAPRGAESGDDVVTENLDGTYTVTGSTGNEYADTFEVTGNILSFRRTGGASDWRLELDGEDVTDTIPEPDIFDVWSTTSGEELTYEFVVNPGGHAGLLLTGDHVSSPRGAEEGQEIPTRNDDGSITVTGRVTDEFADTFRIAGDIRGFIKTGGESGYRLELNGTNVTDDLTGLGIENVYVLFMPGVYDADLGRYL